MNENAWASELTEAARRELAPTGVVRVGIAIGAAMSAVWSTRDAVTGEPRGVTVDLGKALARWLRLPLELVEYESSGAIIEAVDSGRWDVSFVPVDAERKKRVNFGPNYFLGESTYLVRASSPITTIADVDAAGVRVVGVENTATLRTARKTLTHAAARGVAGLDEAIALFRAGEADAVALGRESLMSLLPKLPDARILDGHFHAAGTAVAVPRDRHEALTVVSAFIEQAKVDGTVRAIFDRNGMQNASVAPPGSMS